MVQDVSEVLKETDKLEDHFNHFDVNDSGTIDTNELGDLMKRCGQKLSRSQLRDLVKELDSNQSGDIDFDEFCEMMLERELNIVRESLDNHYDPAIHAGIEGGEDALIGFRCATFSLSPLPSHFLGCVANTCARCSRFGRVPAVGFEPTPQVNNKLRKKR